MSFVSYKIKIKSLGARLREAREKLGFSLQKVEKEIGISQKYLLSLEEDEYSSLPADVYVKGYLIRYANFLHLDPQEIVECYQKEKTLGVSQAKNKFITPQKSGGKIFKKITPRTIFLFLGISIVFFYLLFAFVNLMRPPKITIISPEDNLISNQTQIKIEGKVEPETEVKINDEPIETLVDGHFSKTLELSRGINFIKISAKKKHSRERIIFRKIIVE